MLIILFSSISLTKFSLYIETRKRWISLVSYTKGNQIEISELFISDLPSLSSRYFEWETRSTDEVDIIVEDSAQVHEVMSIDCLNCIAYFFLHKRDKIDEKLC